VPSKRLSLRRPLVIAGVSTTACALIFLTRGIVVDWDSANLVNFLVAWIPFALSVLLAFIPDRELKMPRRVAWRSCVIFFGLCYSILLYHQQSLATAQTLRDQSKIVADAVHQSNQHSDENIENVKKELQQDLASTKTDLANQVSKTGFDLNTSIGKVGKPDPPELAKLQFSLYVDGILAAELPKLARSIKRQTDGTIPVDVFFINTSSTAAETIDVWIQLGSGCSFAQEPQGYVKLDGMSESTRHRVIALMNPGTAFATTRLNVKCVNFDIGFNYSCKACGLAPNWQVAKVEVPIF
jgi:hypothetical protein